MSFVFLRSTIATPVKVVTSITIVHCGVKDVNKRYRPREAKREGLGLPEILEYEKKISTVSAKVEPSLKKWILKRGGSRLIRDLILDHLRDQGQEL